MYPPRRTASSTQLASGAGGFRNTDGSQDPERAIPGMPQPSLQQHSTSSSWDLLNGIRKFEHSYEEFDSRNASESHLVYAEGDLPKNKVRF